MLIDWRDLLLALAEIAIAITGFSGIIGVLGARGRMGRASAEFFKLRWMLDYSWQLSAPPRGGHGPWYALGRDSGVSARLRGRVRS